jgi:hypothetical protein
MAWLALPMFVLGLVVGLACVACAAFMTGALLGMLFGALDVALLLLGRRLVAG